MSAPPSKKRRVRSKAPATESDLDGAARSDAYVQPAHQSDAMRGMGRSGMPQASQLHHIQQQAFRDQMAAMRPDRGFANSLLQGIGIPQLSGMGMLGPMGHPHQQYNPVLQQHLNGVPSFLLPQMQMPMPHMMVPHGNMGGSSHSPAAGISPSHHGLQRRTGPESPAHHPPTSQAQQVAMLRSMHDQRRGGVSVAALMEEARRFGAQGPMPPRPSPNPPPPHQPPPQQHQPMVNIQELRNIDPDMDRARDEALRTAEVDRAKFRREQQMKWITGNVTAMAELDKSAFLLSLRLSPPFTTLCTLPVRIDPSDLDGPAAPAPPIKGGGAGAGAGAGGGGAAAAVREARRSVAGILELEMQALKWYQAASVPYFEEAGQRIADMLVGLDVAADIDKVSEILTNILTEVREGLFKLPEVMGQIPSILLAAQRRRCPAAAAAAAAALEQGDGVIVID